MRDELDRRASFTAAVLTFMTERPLQWISARDLMSVGGALAWRTRLSDARKVVKRDGGDIEWNGKTRDSAYRYLPHRPLGPDAGTYRESSLF